MSDSRTVRQLRVVVEAEDYDAAVAFYRDVLGMPELAAFAEGGDDRVAILDAGRATLDSPARRTSAPSTGRGDGLTSPRIRIALEVDDTAGHTDRLVDAGAELVAEPVMTPWRSLNSRLEAPAGLTITLFQETEGEADRTRGRASPATPTACRARR